MLGIRLLLGLVGIVLVLTLLGYTVSRDPRWLRLAGIGLKAGLALVVILMLLYLLERLLIAL